MVTVFGSKPAPTRRRTTVAPARPTTTRGGDDDEEGMRWWKGRRFLRGEEKKKRLEAIFNVFSKKRIKRVFLMKCLREIKHPTSFRGLRGADKSGQKALIKKNKQHLSIYKKQNIIYYNIIRCRSMNE